MADPVATPYFDRSLEQQAMRKSGLLGRGGNMGNALYAIDYDSLPPQARATIASIVAGGPYPYPNDGTSFGNRFGDLPQGKYLEYTVPTPGVNNRGKRRIVARKKTAQLFFTACHYERVQVTGPGTQEVKAAARVTATAAVDPEWQNGFYIVTGMMPDLKRQIEAAIRAIPD